jgi:transcriptional regulator with XRE-family HTH domain
MSNGGQRLKELLKERGFVLETVADAIGISSRAMRSWTNTAPIDKLIRLSDFTGIPLIDVVESFRPDRDDPIEADRAGGDSN